MASRPFQPILRPATAPALLNPLALAALLALGVAAAHAQTAAPAAAVATRELPRLVVSATRIETPEDEVPATLTVIEAKDIARLLPTDLQDLLRHEAGISVRALPNRASAAFYATGRGGNEGINIRGLEGNQVMLQVDGVRLPMVYASGPVFAGRGDTIDPEAFKRVELLRGPSSTSYGSDGLAGAVSFVTKDPADLLTLGKPTQGSIKLGYATVDKSWVAVPSFAVRNEGFEAMVLASIRRGHEAETQGDRDVPDNTRTVPNPQDVKSDHLLAKLVWKPDARQQVRLSVEGLDRHVDTDVFTLFGDPSYPTTVDVDAREHITRSLVKLDYEVRDPANTLFQRANASLFGQEAENRQFGHERRTNTTAWNSRTRDALYGERTVGGGLQFESNLGRDIVQRLVYGLDFSNTRVHSLKDGANLLNGNVVTTGASAFVVNKSFPDTDYQLFGAFVQDEITIGSVSIIPGLRYDRFVLDPEQGDPLYTINNATPPSKLSGHELSPRLGVVWTLNPLLRVFAQAAHGFRAPTPPQVNGGVTNLTANPPYTSIGNPNLKPETSNSLEVGLRGRNASLRYSASVFSARYEDFIAANQRVGGAGTAASPVIFQSINLGGVRISGVEASVAWTFRPNWTASLSVSHAKGDSVIDAGVRTPLLTIDPDKAVLGLKYDRGHWGGEVVVTAMEGKRRNPTPATAYTARGFAVADLAAWYDLNRNLSLNVALTNLFDRKYAMWADVRDLSPTSTLVDAYTQPGRNLAISARYQF